MWEQNSHTVQIVLFICPWREEQEKKTLIRFIFGRKPYNLNWFIGECLFRLANAERFWTKTCPRSSSTVEVKENKIKDDMRRPTQRRRLLENIWRSTAHVFIRARVLTKDYIYLRTICFGNGNAPPKYSQTATAKNVRRDSNISSVVCSSFDIYVYVKIHSRKDMPVAVRFLFILLRIYCRWRHTFAHRMRLSGIFRTTNTARKKNEQLFLEKYLSKLARNTNIYMHQMAFGMCFYLRPVTRLAQNHLVDCENEKCGRCHIRTRLFAFFWTIRAMTMMNIE